MDKKRTDAAPPRLKGTAAASQARLPSLPMMSTSVKDSINSMPYLEEKSPEKGQFKMAAALGGLSEQTVG